MVLHDAGESHRIEMPLRLLRHRLVPDNVVDAATTALLYRAGKESSRVAEPGTQLEDTARTDNAGELVAELPDHRPDDWESLLFRVRLHLLDFRMAGWNETLEVLHDVVGDKRTHSLNRIP